MKGRPGSEDTLVIIATMTLRALAHTVCQGGHEMCVALSYGDVREFRTKRYRREIHYKTSPFTPTARCGWRCHFVER
jgi:hypothetical protein